MKDSLSHNGPCSHISWRRHGRAASLLCTTPSSEVFAPSSCMCDAPSHWDFSLGHGSCPSLAWPKEYTWVKVCVTGYITTQLYPQFEVCVVGATLGFWWIPFLRSDVQEQSHLLICEYHIPLRDTKMCSVILKSLHCVKVWFMRSAIHHATLVLLALACWYMS